MQAIRGSTTLRPCLTHTSCHACSMNFTTGALLAVYNDRPMATEYLRQRCVKAQQVCGPVEALRHTSGKGSIAWSCPPFPRTHSSSLTPSSGFPASALNPFSSSPFFNLHPFPLAYLAPSTLAFPLSPECLLQAHCAWRPALHLTVSRDLGSLAEERKWAQSCSRFQDISCRV